MTKARSTYRTVNRVLIVFLLTLVATALTFIGLRPTGDFDTWMRVTVLSLAGVSIILASIKMGMQLENPSNV